MCWLLLAVLLTACQSADTADVRAGRDAGTRPSEAGPTSPAAGLKIALVGDQGVNEQAHGVLQLVADEHADALIALGDFTYGEATPADWATQLTDVLGTDFPFFGLIGNHDRPDWAGEHGFEKMLRERLAGIADARCEGEYGVKASCTFRGLHFVMSGIGTYGDGHEEYLESALESSDAAVHLCLWHKNQRDMQIGEKADEIGWEAYQVCARHGVPIITGHEHSYSRTQALAAIGDAEQMHGATGEMSDIELSPGRTFTIVSGLGGRSRRERTPGHEHDGWWASIYARNDQQLNGVQVGTDAEIEDGALFIELHVDGDPYKAHGYFKTVDGAVQDDFTWHVRAPRDD